jgi:hypothetical protein
MKLQKYRRPPKRVFRQLGLGVLADGYIKVLAGFRTRWWDPFSTPEPLYVQARVLRLKTKA